MLQTEAQAIRAQLNCCSKDNIKEDLTVMRTKDHMRTNSALPPVVEFGKSTGGVSSPLYNGYRRFPGVTRP
jgi:hypothetical protein